jgi:hypothetical protein
MNNYGSLAGRRRNAADIALSNERSDHLDTEINRRDDRTFMVV